MGYDYDEQPDYYGDGWSDGWDAGAVLLKESQRQLSTCELELKRREQTITSLNARLDSLNKTQGDAIEKATEQERKNMQDAQAERDAIQKKLETFQKELLGAVPKELAESQMLFIVVCGLRENETMAFSTKEKAEAYKASLGRYSSAKIVVKPLL